MDPLPGPAGSKPKLIIPPSVKEVNVRLARPDERRRLTGVAPSPYQGLAGPDRLAVGPRDLWIGWRQREQFPLHLIE